MHRHIDDALMARLGERRERLTAPEARLLVSQFGALARWWLHHDVLERACSGGAGAVYRERLTTPPRLPARNGACWVVFAQSSPDVYPLLRPAFALPLQWVDELCPQHLPKGLQEVAESVRSELQPSDEWSLRLALGGRVGNYDLSGLSEDFGFESAWAPLAGALLGAECGGHSNPEAWASGAWKRFDGVQSVGQVKEKVALASRHGASLFFLPEDQVTQEEKTEAARQGIELCKLTQRTSDVREALREYTKLSHIEPDEKASLDDKWNWYYSLDEEAADEFLRKQLLTSIVNRTRAQFKKDNEDAPLPTIGRLITICGDNITLSLISVGILRPDRCLLLHSQDKQGMADNTKKAIRQYVKEIECVESLPFETDHNLALEVASAVHAFVDGVAPEEVAFDVTPGTKLMTVALAHDLAADQNLLLYIKHGRQGRTSKVQRDSHRVVVRPAAQTGSASRTQQ